MTQSNHPVRRPHQRCRRHHHRADPPDSMPAVVRIVWPTAAMITTPTRYLEVAADQESCL
jgi:hypothetical protein